VTTAAVRVAILVGAVVIGAIVIANAFPTQGSPGASPATSPTSSPSSSPSPHHPAVSYKLNCSSVQNTRVAVENATTTQGLAAATATLLQHAGYLINSQDIGNAPTSSATTTTVYYRTGADRTAARCLRKKYFHGAEVQQLPANAGISSAVQVAVYLGADYASQHPVH
jgi:LytR cell envelope-related transcriptional attenuator